MGDGIRGCSAGDTAHSFYFSLPQALSLGTLRGAEHDAMRKDQSPKMPPIALVRRVLMWAVSSLQIRNAVMMVSPVRNIRMETVESFDRQATKEVQKHPNPSFEAHRSTRKLFENPPVFEVAVMEPREMQNNAR
jgi:hypothetical protein